MPRRARKVRRNMAKVDRTRNLPAQVVDLILSYVPLRDSVRTSILSTDWRYMWATAPKLEFDKSCCSASWKSRIADENEALAKIIDHVLLLHMGPIEILKIKDITAIPDIDRWILHVCRQPIKELELKVSGVFGREDYRIPSSLYGCESMVKLMISNCILTPPSSFKGLGSLRYLCLNDCTLEAEAFANLISSLPLLEKLTLTDFDGPEDLEIDAKNLQCVEIQGTFESLTFGRTMARLSNVDITMERDLDTLYIPLFEYEESGLTEFLINLPSIQQLKIQQFFLRHLAVGLIPNSLPFCLKDLYHLGLCVDFSHPNDTMATLCLLNSSPNLMKLRIECWDDEETKDAPSAFADVSKCYCRFEKLRQVEMFHIYGIKEELEFIKLVLANSPVLEKMTLIPPYEKDNLRLRLKDILRFERLSPEAEIISTLNF